MTGLALVAGGTGKLGTAVVGALAARGYGVAIHCHGALARARSLAASFATLHPRIRVACVEAGGKPPDAAARDVIDLLAAAR